MSYERDIERREARDLASREAELDRAPVYGEVNPLWERRFTIALGAARASATAICRTWVSDGHGTRSWFLQSGDGRKRMQRATIEWACERVWMAAHDVDSWTTLHPDDEALRDAFVQEQLDRHESFLAECRILCDDPDSPVLPPLEAGTPAGFVYLVAPARSSRAAVKIGFTMKDPHKRLVQLQTGSLLKLKLLAYVRGTRNDERLLHKRFSHLRRSGEWFDAAYAISQAFTRLRADPTRRP